MIQLMLLTNTWTCSPSSTVCAQTWKIPQTAHLVDKRCTIDSRRIMWVKYHRFTLKEKPEPSLKTVEYHAQAPFWLHNHRKTPSQMILRKYKHFTSKTF